MIEVETFNWGNFEGENLQEVKEKIVQTLFNQDQDSFVIDQIKVNGNYLEPSIVFEIKWDILDDLLAYKKKAVCESLGYLNAQQEC